MAKDYIKNIEMQTILAADLGVGFKVVDINGFQGPLNFIRIKNRMDQPLIISFDGIYGHEYLKINDSIDLNIQLCSIYLNKKCLFRNRAKIYVKKVDNVPKGGALIVMGFYQAYK